MSPITNPTALADQHQAAVREAARANRTMQASGRATLTYLSAPTPWLASQFAQLHAAVINGTARCCEHLNDGPRVAFAAAWAPGLIVCAPCAPAMTPDPDEDSTCDKCRTRVPLIHPRSATFGPLVFAYGLCPACAADEPDKHGPNRAAGRRARR
jgi:hypothetical protein